MVKTLLKLSNISILPMWLINLTPVKMIAILQRVSEASVKIEGQIKGEIGVGFMVLLGITHADTQDDVEWLAKKIVGMRIFSDEVGKMNLDLESVNGNILLISQFTLHASTKKGNRPSFIEAARPEIAIPLYEKMIVQLENLLGKTIQTGEFGADMKVSLVNDGPVTIMIDSKNKI
jgi:D-aminoacyl-tRNA deacylase